MEGTLTFLIGLSAWAAVLLRWWSQRDDWLRKKFAVSLKDWRDQTNQAELLYYVAEDLTADLSKELGVPNRTLKQQYREQAAKKRGQDPRWELMQPARLRATLSKIETRERHLESGFRLRFRRRRRKSHHQEA